MSFKTIAITLLVLGTQITVCDVGPDRGLKLAGHQYGLNGLTGYDLTGCDAAVQQSTEAAQAVNLANKAIKIHAQAAAVYETTWKTAEHDLGKILYDETIREKSVNLLKSTQAAFRDACHFADITIDSACKKSGFIGHNKQFRDMLRDQKKGGNSTKLDAHLNTLEHCTKKLPLEEQNEIITEVNKAFQDADNAQKAERIAEDDFVKNCKIVYPAVGAREFHPDKQTYDAKQAAQEVAKETAFAAKNKAWVAANSACIKFGYDGYFYQDDRPFKLHQCVTAPL